MTVKALDWDDDGLLLLDQRQLPIRAAWIRCTNAGEVADAISQLVVRGAPAIGVAAAYGLALSVRRDPELTSVEKAAADLVAARPTAVNLAWAVRRLFACVRDLPAGERAAAALAEARAIQAEDEEACLQMGRYGADLVGGDRVEILTHCNTGALATAGVGTALGVVREISSRGQLARLWMCEARPVQQGARLTAWEAEREGLPATLICDTAAGAVLLQRPIAAVIVGADRIAADGSTANKVGTYQLAVLAARHGVPFYVVAPTSTVDLDLPDGPSIPIEVRDADEVRRVRGLQVAPLAIEVFNPAFDVTPPELVTAIVTESGVAREPFAAGLRALCGEE